MTCHTMRIFVCLFVFTEPEIGLDSEISINNNNIKCEGVGLNSWLDK